MNFFPLIFIPVARSCSELFTRRWRSDSAAWMYSSDGAVSVSTLVGPVMIRITSWMIEVLKSWLVFKAGTCIKEHKKVSDNSILITFGINTRKILEGKLICQVSLSTCGLTKIFITENFFIVIMHKNETSVVERILISGFNITRLKSQQTLPFLSA